MADGQSRLDGTLISLMSTENEHVRGAVAPYIVQEICPVYLEVSFDLGTISYHISPHQRAFPRSSSRTLAAYHMRGGTPALADTSQRIRHLGPAFADCWADEGVF